MKGTHYENWEIDLQATGRQNPTKTLLLRGHKNEDIISTCPDASAIALVEIGNPYESRFDVQDGKGQIACNANVFYLSLVRSLHPRYKASYRPEEKRLIAAIIFDAISREGGRFLDINGEPKSRTESMKKIMKSLKDMKSKTKGPSRVEEPPASKSPCSHSRLLRLGRAPPPLTASIDGLDLPVGPLVPPISFSPQLVDSSPRGIDSSRPPERSQIPMVVESRLDASLDHPIGLDEVWDTDEEDELMVELAFLLIKEDED
jgi:hypothetical protein